MRARTKGFSIEEFKEQQRAMWAAGDYVTLSDYVRDMGKRLIARADVEPGMAVLDVACGTGNAAIPAARAGASVTGLDLVPKLLEGGRQKAAAEGVEVEWVEGDAEDLPFPDKSFDRVFSTIGHMFAPRHRRTADEMSRVCREGGLIATTTWTPEGTVGDVFAASASYMPPPPDFVEPPILWGAEEHVRKMFPHASEFEFERHSATIEWESVEGFANFFFDRFGPLVTAREMLGDGFAELGEKIKAVFAERNEATDGTLRLPQEYLLSAIRL
jgi:ubiquinone/menaquinone biosynthesis C-methylase UbiE